MPINSSSPKRPKSSDFNKRGAGRLSTSAKFRRRGRRNRFATQASRDSEPERIIALMTQGLKVPDIAEAMKLSVPTVYRRIAAIRVPTEGASAQNVGRREKMAAALLALLQANTRRIHALAAERMEKRNKDACCPDCARTGLELESIRLANEVHKVEIAYHKQLGTFDAIRASGRALEIIQKARTLEEPEKVLRGAADNTGTSAVV